MGRPAEDDPTPLTVAPTADELVDLARRLAAEDPGLLPAFLCSLCRSPRASRACRALAPRGADLAALRAYPVGARLIAASTPGAAWLRRWTETEQALDQWLPPLPGARPPASE